MADWAGIKKINSNIDVPLDKLAVNTAKRRLIRVEDARVCNEGYNDITRYILNIRNRSGILRFLNTHFVPAVNNVTATSVQGTNDMTCDVNILIDNEINIKFELNARTYKPAGSGTAYKSCNGCICDDMFYKPDGGTKVTIPNTTSNILNNYTAYVSQLDYSSATNYYSVIPRVNATSDNIVYLHLFKHGLLFNNLLEITVTPHNINSAQTVEAYCYTRLYYEYLD